jgi:hypothetical protein
MRHAGRRRGVKLDPAIANRRIPSGSGLAPNSIADEPPGISPGGFPSGGSNRPSCVLSGRNHDHRAILLQVPADHAVGGGTRRSICFVAVAAQRAISRHEGKWCAAALTPKDQGIHCVLKAARRSLRVFDGKEQRATINFKEDGGRCTSRNALQLSTISI